MNSHKPLNRGCHTLGMHPLIATLPGDRRKTISNKSEEQVLVDYVVPYVSRGTISAKWGKKTNSYQVVQLRIFGTKQAWDKKSGQKLEDFIGKKRNQYNKFEKKAQKSLGIGSWRCFIVMPIQGEKFGSQEDQRIYREYDERFEATACCRRPSHRPCCPNQGARV